MRGFTNDMLSEAFNKPKVDIPRAPALGLLLDSVNYKTYNLRFGEDGVHEKLDWLEYEVNHIWYLWVNCGIPIIIPYLASNYHYICFRM